MASQMAILTRTTKTLMKALYPQIKSISSFAHPSQEAHLATDHPPSDHPNPNSNSTPFPPNPASGSPLYNDTNWRNPIPIYQNPNSPMIPLGPFHNQTSRIQSMPPNMDLNSLSNMLADWTTSQRWEDIKGYFEAWIKSLDRNGKPNKPDVSLYNHYLRANLMMKASAGYLLDLVAQMEDFNLSPNTVSFNFVLKAMYEGLETEAAEKLLQRMEHTGKESQPDEESYDLVVTMLLNKGNIDAFDTALKYIDKILKGDYVLSMKVFDACVRSCCNFGRLDVLLSIIEKCKKMDQNKALCPNWNLCNHIAEIALKEDNSKLLFCALEFMARWIARGEKARPIVLLSVDEGLIVAALGTAGRTYNSTLLDASWAILCRSLRQKKAPNPESYIGKIYAHASLGSLQKAFATLRELESCYGSSDKEAEEELFSPFSSLNPLVLACSKKGFETLDSVYFQLENLSRAESPYKSVAALNCIILGCANIWDLDRAYQTFEAISSSFGLTPNIHSYNALIFAFGRLKKTFEASNVFEHLVSLGVKPNAMSYSLLVDAHLINRDTKAAVLVIEKMDSAGFVPSKEILKKVKRRCIREMEYESDDRVEFWARKFDYRLGSQNRRDLLFNLEYSTDFA
ncbi:hypothetical protein POPTR_010G159100v4 [Populus trichocarpa]|uniref:Uncharacterized protein n=1 Tax=Populus trichocarpa TaxID=3694 RepID=A0ACC0SDS8_POPTR|nr:pentatricopeptide repeat-containing protein At1g26460, mitochondrial [Populus trichocarpa]KAI9387359.1 hypothetical protein POPTR_010G159100v4 [Populus trichocarpa]